MAKKRYRQKKMENKNIAKQRIEYLFQLAEKKARSGDAEYARRAIIMARRLGTKYKIRIPRRYKQNFCKKCNYFFLSDKQARVRMSKGKIVRTCQYCRNISRTPYIREKKGMNRTK